MTCDQNFGKDAALYYNSGDYTTPVWEEIGRVSSVTLNLGKNTASTATREITIDTQGGGLRTASLTFTYLNKPGADTVFDFLQTAYVSDTCDEYLILDGPEATAGSKGWRMYGMVTQMNNNQDLEVANTHDCEVVVTRFDDAGTTRIMEPVTMPIA